MSPTTQKPKVSDAKLQEYQSLHPEKKQVPPNMIRNEAWVQAKIDGFNAPPATEPTPTPAPAGGTTPAAPAAESTPSVPTAPVATPPAAPAEEVPTAKPAAPAPPVVPMATLKADLPEFVDQIMTQEMKDTKKKLEIAPRVMFSVPKAEWEAVGAYETVTINGYRMVIKKGVMVELPLPVFQILANKYNIENTAGMANRLDVNPQKNPELAGNINQHV